jgi:hypothetical protein
VFSPGSEVARTPSVFASRSVTADGRVFALTGDGDHYSNAEGHREIVALAAAGATVLAKGSAYEWIDRPKPGVVIAYPATCLPDSATGGSRSGPEACPQR